jgi:tetrahedral aminopeptidase
MNTSSLDFLKQLLAAPSPSGYEQPAQLIWRKYTKAYAESMDSDLHGNSIAALHASGHPRIMLAGHCDELGFVVKYIDDKGYIYFETIGGHDAILVPGRRVTLYTSKGAIYGITGRKAIHLLNKEDRAKVPEISNIWIDIGSSSREETLERVALGDPIVHDASFTMLNENLVASRGLDDKIGAFIVAQTCRSLAKKSLAAAVFGVATVQEEIGLRGAQTSAYAIDPQIGIAIDVTHATDHPDMQPQKHGCIKLGAGPVILRGANANAKLVELLLQVAKEQNIPYQIEVSGGATGTDANRIQLSRQGVAAALISIPLRYMHTPVEVISLQDAENAVRLLAALCELLTPEMDFRL